MNSAIQLVRVPLAIGISRMGLSSNCVGISMFLKIRGCVSPGSEGLSVSMMDWKYSVHEVCALGGPTSWMYNL